MRQVTSLGGELPGYLDLPVAKLRGRQPAETAPDPVAVEHYLTIGVTRSGSLRPVATLACTPDHLEELVAGFLVGQGLLPVDASRAGGDAGRGAIFRCEFDGDRRVARVTLGETHAASPGSGPVDQDIVDKLVTSGCGAGLVFDQARLLLDTPPVVWDGTLAASFLSDVSATLQRLTSLFRLTGGTHSALATESEQPSAFMDGRGEGRLCYREDIGRHNAVDKVIGHLWLAGKLGRRPATRNEKSPAMASNGSALILVTTGRLSSDIVLKAARAGCPVVVSHGAPTTMAVSVAGQLGLTLVGFARGDRLNVYSHPGRVG